MGLHNSPKILENAITVWMKKLKYMIFQGFYMYYVSPSPLINLLWVPPSDFSFFFFSYGPDTVIIIAI